MLFLLCIFIQEISAEPIYFRSVAFSSSGWSTYHSMKKKLSQSKRNRTFTVTLTTYNPVTSQCDADPLITANGTKIDTLKVKSGEQRIAAISRDLLDAIPMGSEIYIEGHGNYIVADLMNKRFTHYVDILQSIDKKNFKKDNIKVTLIKKTVK